MKLLSPTPNKRLNELAGFLYLACGLLLLLSLDPLLFLDPALLLGTLLLVLLVCPNLLLI